MHPPPAQVQALRARLARGAPLAVAQAAVQLAGRHPQSWQPWALLAQALARAGQAAESQTAWTQAQARATTRDDRLLLAQEALNCGAHDVADTQLTLCCNAEPDNAPLWLHLSRMRRARGLAAAARPVAQALTRRHPARVDAWLELAEVEAERADLRACRSAVHTALDRLGATVPPPADADATRVTAARLLLATGFAAEAEELVGTVPAEAPRRDVTLGLILERRGRPQDALALLDPWIASGQANPVELGVWARILRKGPRVDEARTALQAALHQVSDAPTRRLLLHRLGEVEQARGDWDATFQAHAAANASGRLPWSRAHFDRELAAIHALADRAAPVPDPDGPGAGIVLIAGMPRSGTSLLEQILTTHPAIRGIGESPALRQCLTTLPGPADLPWATRLAQAPPAALRQAGAQYAAAVAAEAGPSGVRLDKTPPNLMLVDGLARVLPGARAVLLRRDPRDTCVSCFFQSFGPFYAWTDHLPWLGHVARELDGLRTRFLAAPPLPVLGLDYEALVREPERSLRQVLAFLGLPWDPVVLSFHRQSREMRTASYDQVRSPIHTKSIGRATRYDRWLGPLDAALSQPPGR